MKEKHFSFSRANLLYGFDAEKKKLFIDQASRIGSPRYLYRFGVENPVGIDDVREIQRRALLSSGTDLQFFIIERADIMTREAKNALLKILEEPPASSYFFLIAQSRESFPETILSRVRQFAFLGTPEAFDETNAEEFLMQESARLRAALEDHVRTKHNVPHDILRHLKKCIDLSVLLASSRVAPKYILEAYKLTC